MPNTIIKQLRIQTTKLRIHSTQFELGDETEWRKIDREIL